MLRFDVILSLLVLALLIAGWGILGFPLDIESIPARATEAYQEHRAGYDSAYLILERIAEFFDSHDGAVTAVATAFIAIFTIVLARVASRQLQDARILQRAYISVEPCGIEPGAIDRSDRILGRIAIRNRGHLPARNVSWWISITTALEKKDFPIEQIERRASALAPGAEMEVASPNMITDRMQNFIYVWGMVTYRDGFGARRFTRFCHRYDSKASLDGGVFTIRPENARYHEYGNDAN